MKNSDYRQFDIRSVSLDVELRFSVLVFVCEMCVLCVCPYVFLCLSDCTTLIFLDLTLATILHIIWFKQYK